MGQYKRYTNDDVCAAASKVYSLASLLDELGLIKAGGNYNTMRKKLQELKIDTSHWTGQAWSKGQQLKNWSEYSKAANLKPHLIKERGHICEKCKLSEWLNQSITLETHHVDGDRTNNVLTNLQLLCPNCHSYTDTWRKSKCGKAPVVKGNCIDCFQFIHKDSVRCRTCDIARRTKVKDICTRTTKIQWPSHNELVAMLAKSNYTKLGKHLGVSDNAVRKRLMAKNH
jgi:dimeric dUTPase (all-alpha-NTP-PPase superfamily)